MLSTYDNAVAARPNGFNAGGLRLPVRPRLLERLGEAGTVPGSQRLTVLRPVRLRQDRDRGCVAGRQRLAARRPLGG